MPHTPGHISLDDFNVSGEQSQNQGITLSDFGSLSNQREVDYNNTISAVLRPVRVPEAKEQLRVPPTITSAFQEGLGAGALFIQPDIPFMELESGSLMAARAAGNVLGMFGVHGILSAMTGGSSTLAALSLKGAQTAKGLKKIQDAGKAYQAGQKIEAIGSVGFGQTYNLFGSRVAKSSAADKFFNLAAKDPNQALTFLKRGRMVKEAKLFGLYGQVSTASTQIQSDEAFSIQKQILALPGDIVGGALFAKGGFLKATNVDDFNLAGFKISKSLTKGTGYMFSAGALSSGLNGADLNPQERLINGLMVGALGNLSRGTEFKSTKNNVAKVLREEAPDLPESLVNDITEAAVRKAVKEIENVPSFFEGLNLTSKSGFTARIKQFGKGTTKGRVDKPVVIYDVLDKNGNVRKNSKNVERTLDEFVNTYTSTPEDVTRIMQNVDVNGVVKSFFKTDKDAKRFWESGKWVAVTVDKASHKQNLKVLPGESPTESLVRDLLARGYKEKDIMRVQRQADNGYQNTFIIKNMKESDAIQVGQLTGHDRIMTHKGVLELVRKKKNGIELEEVVLHSKIAGSTVTGAAEEQGKRMITKKHKVLGGGGTASGNVVELPKRGSKGKPQRKGGTGNGIYGATNGDKFKGNDIFSVTLQNGNVIAVGNQIAYGSVTRKTKTPKKILGARDVEFIRGQSASTRGRVTDDELRRLHQQVINADVDSGFRNKNGQGVHRDLKELLFNTRSTKGLSAEQAKTYQAVLTGLADADVKTGIKVIDDHLGDLNRVELSAATNGILMPMYRTYEFLYKKTGATVFKKISEKLVNKVLDQQIFSGYIYTMRRAQDTLLKNAPQGLAKDMLKDFDKVMVGLIDPNFKHLLAGYDANYLKRFQPMVEAHKKTMKKIVKVAQNLGKDENGNKLFVKETYYKNGRPEKRMIQEVKNFMPLTVNFELLDAMNKSNSLMTAVLRRLKRDNPRATEEELLVLYKRFANNTTKNGIYGAQYSRRIQLDPVYFLDENNRFIPSIADDYNKKVGDLIGGKKIAKRIDAYDYNYINSIDRYGGRISNIMTLTKHFGDGIYKFGSATSSKKKEYTDGINSLINEIALQVSEKGEVSASQLIKLFEDDLAKIVKTEARGVGLDVTRELVGTSAAFGLSGVISPLKNFILGQVQTISTVGLVQWSKAFARTMQGSDFRKTYLVDYDKLAVGQSGMKLLDTAFNYEGTGAYSKFKRAITTGMTLVEQRNRLIAIAAFDLSAENALKILRNPKSSAQAKTKAARFLRETVSMGDDYAKAVDSGEFTDLMRSRIMVRGQAITQGITDVAMLPRLFSNDMVKPFTLFTRIATIVTDNVYNNVVRPAREGDIAPMLRYIATSALGGAAIAEYYHWAYNQERDYWKSTPEKVWDYLAYGEFMGSIGIINDFIQPLRSDTQGRNNFVDTFPVARQGYILARLPFLVGKQVYKEVADMVNEDNISNDPEAERYAFIEEASKITALTSSIYNIVTPRTQSLQSEYEKITQNQRNYQSIHGVKQGFKIPAKGAGYEKNIHYQYLKKSFYSDAPPQLFANAFRAAVVSRAHQLQLANNRAMSPIRAYRQAFDDVTEYVDQLDPLKLSKERGNREFSPYDDWYSKLSRDNKEFLMRYEQLNSFYRQRRGQVMGLARQLSRQDEQQFRKEMQYWRDL